MSEILKIAASVIEKSSADQPADSVLRDQLRKQRGLSRDDGWEISQAVFAYYRWFGWLDKSRGLSENIRQATALAAEFKSQPETFSDADLVEKSVPGWIHQQVKISAALVRVLQAEPRLWLRAKRGEQERVMRYLRHCLPHPSEMMPDTLEYTGSLDLFRTPEFHEGMFELQDVASQAVSVICDPKPGQTWWDACAGEGGKTLHFSELMENKGLIWASDRAEWRLKRLKQRTARAKAFNYRAVQWDGGQKLPTKTKFDGVLVDAPCSGVGTWGRNPHARWTTTLKDVQELAEIQLDLLRHVAGSIKPGGKLVYSVCTLARSECTEIANRFQGEVSGFEALPFTNPLQPERMHNQLFIWPQDSGGNGMFVACWQKI